MQDLIFSLNAVMPVFLLVFLGIFLKRTNVIDKRFAGITSKLVFSVSIPALVFLELSRPSLYHLFDFKTIAFVYIGVLLFYILTWLLSLSLSSRGEDQGAFIQTSIRSNFAIVGFAIIYNMFGNQALSKAAIILAFVMPFWNVLAIIALTVPLKGVKQLDMRSVAIDIILNPLIVATLLALPFSIFEMSLPQFMTRTLENLAALSLPLALLSIGASLNFQSIRKDLILTITGTLIKIVILPVVLTVTAFLIGFTGEDLGVLFILFATPSAIMSYVMTEAMGGNSELAGNIVLLTTLGSVFTISVGIFMIKSLGLF